MSRGHFNSFAIPLAENGFTVVPTNGKKPATRHWQNPRPTNLKWLRSMVAVGRYVDCNVGIVCGRCVAIDIDADDPGKAARLVKLTVEACGATPFQRVGRPPRTLLLYRPLDEIPSLKIGDCIDVLSVGKQFVAYGIHPDTGQQYQWVEARHTPATAKLDTLPTITVQQVQALAEAVGDRGLRPVGRLPTPRTALTTRHRARQGDMLDNSKDGIIRDPDTGRVRDGREQFLRDLTAFEYAKDKEASPAVLAGRVWARFVAEADVSRCKGSNPRKRWSHADALAKAHAIIRRRPDLKPPRRARGGHTASQLAAWRKPGHWTVEQRERHQAEVARRINTPATLAVERTMIEAVDWQSGHCTMPIAEIAKRAGCSTTAVKTARTALRNSGCWIAARGVWIPVLNRKQGADRKIQKPVAGHTEVASLYRCVVSPDPLPAAASGRLAGYQADLFGADIVDLQKFRRGRVPADLAAAVRSEMRARHLTQTELGRQIGISQPQIANILAGRFGIGGDPAARLRQWLIERQPAKANRG